MTAITADSPIIGTLCALCHEPLEEGQHAADFFVYERYDPTELNYIELAHRDCVLELEPAQREGWDYDDDAHTETIVRTGDGLFRSVCSCGHDCALLFQDEAGARGEGRYHRAVERRPLL